MKEIQADIDTQDNSLIFNKNRISEMGAILNDSTHSLSARFRALFFLRNAKDDLSVEMISNCFSDPSALIKHELAYCLGQMQNPLALPVLAQVLADKEQEPMVRHEAGEALGAFGDSIKNCSFFDLLECYVDDPSPEVSETCQLALKRIKWVKENGNTACISSYNSIDPAPTYTEKEHNNLEALGQLLLDTNQPLWERYRAMFTLRNMNDDKATKILAQGLFSEDSALFRHEIAYVLGQVQSSIAIPELKARLASLAENGMVRHECAEALGSIGTEECQQILRDFLHDPERVVRESCAIALDIAEENKERDV